MHILLYVVYDYIPRIRQEQVIMKISSQTMFSRSVNNMKLCLNMKKYVLMQTSARRSSHIRRRAIAFKLIRGEILLLAKRMRQLTQSIKQSPTT